jgi:hypothetical protein
VDVVDETTVLCLETLAPGKSKADRRAVRRLVAEGKLFGRLNENRRAELDLVLENINAIETVIPSLYTFFEMLKHLEPCARIMRSLVSLKEHKTIKESLLAFYKELEQCPVVAIIMQASLAQ